MSCQRVLGAVCAALLIMSAGAQAAMPDEAKGPRHQAGEIREAQEIMREERRDDCDNSSEHTCSGLQKGLQKGLQNEQQPQVGRSDIVPESQGQMTGKGHERGDAPGMLKGMGHKGKSE